MIKNFSHEDFEKCCELYIHVFNSPPWNDQWTDEKVKNRLREFCDGARFAGFTLWEGGELIGAVFARGSTYYKGDELYVDELFISPEHQRKGYGTALMDAVEKYARENNCTNISLLTGRGMPSFDFYEKRGYKHLEHLTFMYKRV